MLRLFVFILVLFSFLGSTKTSELKPFTSDGCSAFPEGTYRQKELWHGCCVDHDFAYWKGGTSEQRKTADITLKNCVAQVGNPKVAILMLAGVHVGGSPYFPTFFRWGYGWSYPRFYGSLTPAELAQVKQLSPSAE